MVLRRASYFVYAFFKCGDILKIWNLCLVHNGIIITFFFPCSLHDKFYKIKINCLNLVGVQDSILKVNDFRVIMHSKPRFFKSEV